MKTFKLKNKYIAGLIRWLSSQSFSGRKSRARTRFVKILQERNKEYADFMKELVNKYTKKDKEGKVKTEKKEDGFNHYIFKDDKAEKDYLKEIEDLRNEEFVIEISASNEKDINTVKDIVLNTSYKFGPKEEQNNIEKVQASRLAVEYNEWCESFESI